MAYSSKTKQVCQIEFTQIRNDTKKSDNFQNIVACFKSQLKITAMKNKGRLFEVWSKQTYPAPKETTKSSQLGSLKDKPLNRRQFWTK